jgi:hypothetical protein
LSIETCETKTNLLEIEQSIFERDDQKESYSSVELILKRVFKIHYENFLSKKLRFVHISSLDCVLSTTLMFVSMIIQKASAPGQSCPSLPLIRRKPM